MRSSTFFPNSSSDERIIPTWVASVEMVNSESPSLQSEKDSIYPLGTYRRMNNGMLVVLHYSLSHIVQITNFLDFLHEYCEEKSETFTEFSTNFVFNRNTKIIR